MAGFPTALRAPRPPAVWPAGVITGARPATDQETPANAARIAAQAVAAGWEVAVTYALAEGVRSKRVRLAPDPENDRAPKTMLVGTPAEIPSIAVRMLKPGRAMRVAVWVDGAFANCWHRDAIVAPRRLAYPRLARVLRTEAALAAATRGERT